MPLTALMFKRPFEFAVFEWCNRRFGAKSKGPFLGGCVAGVLSALLGCPFSVVKVQMQASRKDRYKHTLEVIQDVWRLRGLRGFYRGLGASLIMSVPSSTFFMGTYGILREQLPPSRWTPALAGMAASLSMWTCLLPLDNVRTVIQAKSFKTGELVAGWHTHFLHVVQTRGVLGLWAGFPAVMVRAPVMSACSMLAYEQARSMMDAMQN